MIRKGCFPQLNRILDLIERANILPEELNPDEDPIDSEDDDDGHVCLEVLPGNRGEAKVAMLDDTLLRTIGWKV